MMGGDPNEQIPGEAKSNAETEMKKKTDESGGKI